MTINQDSKYDFGFFDEFVQNGLKTVIVDIDGTLVNSDITRLYLYIKRKEIQSDILYKLWLAGTYAVYGPYYKLLDEIDRSMFQKAFYKRYGSYTLEKIRHYSREFFHHELKNNFISYVHDLLFFLKKRDVKVILLSTALEPVVQCFSDYFDLPFHCPELKSYDNGCRVDMSNLADFKYYYIVKSASKGLMVIADSRHDLPILKYSEYPVIVANKRERWMKQIQGQLVINNRLEDLSSKNMILRRNK